MGKKSGADPDVASGVRLIGKLCGIIYYMLLMVKQSVGCGHPTAPERCLSRQAGIVWCCLKKQRGKEQNGQKNQAQTRMWHRGCV